MTRSSIDWATAVSARNISTIEAATTPPTFPSSFSCWKSFPGVLQRKAPSSSCIGLYISELIRGTNQWAFAECTISGCHRCPPDFHWCSPCHQRCWTWRAGTSCGCLPLPRKSLPYHPTCPVIALSRGLPSVEVSNKIISQVFQGKMRSSKIINVVRLTLHDRVIF